MFFDSESKKYTTNPVYVGSSVIGMKYKNGVVLATDTRLNYGSLAKFFNIDNRAQRINKNTVIASSGEYSDFQEVIRILNEKALDDNLGNVSYLGPRELTNFLSSIHYERRNKSNPYLNQTLIGGIDWDNSPVLYSVDQFGTLLKGDYMLTGMAQYFCNAIIEPSYPKNYNDLSLEQAVKLLEDSFRCLFYRDTRAGNYIKFVVMEAKAGNEIPHYETFERLLKSEWNYDRFLAQANEKIYLEN